VILVNFWATWCESCREEMPDLNKYHAEFKDKGFEILGISLDSSEEKLLEYIKRTGLEWKMAFSGNGWKDGTVIRYGVNSIPSHWLIDKKGVLRSFGLKGKALRDAIATLVKEK
jgi:thiol-disulfide isomerase/thioredoxin